MELEDLDAETIEAVLAVKARLDMGIENARKEGFNSVRVLLSAVDLPPQGIAALTTLYAREGRTVNVDGVGLSVVPSARS